MIYYLHREGLMTASYRHSRLLTRLLVLAFSLILTTCAGVARQEMATASGDGFSDERDEASGGDYVAERSLAPSIEAVADEEAKPTSADETAVEPSRTLSTDSLFNIKSPELLARIDGPELEHLSLIAQDITIVIVGHRARVVFDFVYYNHSDSQLSGTLYVQVPDRGGPSYLGMFQGNAIGDTEWDADSAQNADASKLLPAVAPEPDKLLAVEPEFPGSWTADDESIEWGEFRPAVIVEPVKGRQIYESVTRQRIDPALGEWTGTGSYSTRIFPLPPRSLKRVVFAYDQTLVSDEGKVTFRLPVAESPADYRRLTVHDVGTTYSIGVVEAAGETVEMRRSRFGKLWTMELDERSGFPVEFHGTMRNPAFLSLSGGDPGIVGHLTTVLVTPKPVARAMVTATGRALIMLDTSYSAKNGMADLSGRILRELLESDDSLTEFAIMCFDVRPTLLTSGFVSNTEAARTHYLTQVEQIWLEGATDFDAALDFIAAADELLDADTIFLLSDGLISWGSDDLSTIRQKHEQILQSRWICYSVGSAPQNTELFRTLTRSGGQIVRVAPSQELSLAARAHRFPVSRLDGVFSVMQDEVIVTGNPEYIYPGQVLEVAVKSAVTASDVRLIVRVDGRDMDIKVPITRLPLTDSMASRAWAEIYTNNLLLDPDEAVAQAVLSLSRHFHLANDYASFIILETDEEYEQFEIAVPRFDFKQIRLTLLETKGGQKEPPRLYSGLAIPAILSSESTAVVKGLAALKQVNIWQTREPQLVLSTPEVLLEKPLTSRSSDSLTDIYTQGSIIFSGDGVSDQDEVVRKIDIELNAAHALRVLSSIGELKPRDAQALRLAGFVLMEWGFYAESARIFTRVRERRPFEPQNLLLEAMALSAMGLIGDAALRYEIVLQNTFPRFDEYTKPVANALYAELLHSVLREQNDHPFKETWQVRLNALEANTLVGVADGRQTPAAGILLLYWNLDDTDVDLHVRENAFSKVWYQRTSSRTGGRLFWDNTAGLGPEMYQHPKLIRSGFEVSVNYFSSSSVEGAAPAATLVAAFTHQPALSMYGVEWHARVLMNVEEELVEIMPIWKRAR